MCVKTKDCNDMAMNIVLFNWSLKREASTHVVPKGFTYLIIKVQVSPRL